MLINTHSYSALPLLVRVYCLYYWLLQIAPSSSGLCETFANCDQQRLVRCSLVAVRGCVLSFFVVCTQSVSRSTKESRYSTIFDTKMKSTYVICVLLGVMIGTLVLADNGAILKTNKTQMLISSPATESANNITDLKSTAATTNETTTSTPSAATNTSTSETTVTQNTTTPKATTTPTNTTTTTTTTTTTITTTTTTTAVPNITTTTTPTTPTTVTTVTPSKTTSHVSTSTTAAKTTAIPPAPSKDRQFDGLSFFGGIILTTCLMAIAAFSWRFYKQCKEGNYRTL